MVNIAKKATALVVLSAMLLSNASAAISPIANMAYADELSETNDSSVLLNTASEVLEASETSEPADDAQSAHRLGGVKSQRK